jgi:excisionase family DNA binding protein
MKNETQLENARPRQVAAEVPPAKLLLTVRDCSAMTSLSEKTILRLLQRGKLRALSSIRHKRIPASELARFIRENLS